MKNSFLIFISLLNAQLATAHRVENRSAPPSAEDREVYSRALSNIPYQGEVFDCDDYSYFYSLLDPDNTFMMTFYCETGGHVVNVVRDPATGACRVIEPQGGVTIAEFICPKTGAITESNILDSVKDKIRAYGKRGFGDDPMGCKKSFRVTMAAAGTRDGNEDRGPTEFLPGSLQMRRLADRINASGLLDRVAREPFPTCASLIEKSSNRGPNGEMDCRGSKGEVTTAICMVTPNAQGKKQVESLDCVRLGERAYGWQVSP